MFSVPSLGVGKIYPGARFALSTNEDILAEVIHWGPDIIHTQCEFSTFRMAKQIAHYLDIPIVHTYHTVYEDYTHYFSPTKTWGKKLVSLFTRRVLRHVDSVIVPTQKVHHLLKEYGVEQPMHVIPTGIPLEKFQQTLSISEKNALKKEFGIPLNHHLIVAVARLAKEKNMDELLDYLDRLNDPSLELLIVGDGPYREKLETRVQELNLTANVHFTGMVEPSMIRKYYQVADVFVSASTSETQGLSYIEALASGTPALCRKDTCLQGVIQDGINGYQYQSFKQFEERLYSLLLNADLRKRLSEQARIGTQETYGSEQFARKVEEIYNQAIHSHVPILPSAHM